MWSDSQHDGSSVQQACDRAAPADTEAGCARNLGGVVSGKLNQMYIVKPAITLKPHGFT